MGTGHLYSTLAAKMRLALGRAFPEQRLFLRSETSTRFIRLSPTTQLIGLTGSALVVGWTIIASAILFMDAIGSGSVRDQSAREQALYAERLNALSAERDASAEAARAAIERFNAALDQVSAMQTALLEAETRRDEAERGLAVVHDKLRVAVAERDAARTEAVRLAAGGDDARPADADLSVTLNMITAALNDPAEQRDALAIQVAEVEQYADELLFQKTQLIERNDEIFSKLEDALTISVTPLDKMFSQAGLSTDDLLRQVRRGYSGQGGPLTPIRFSTRGEQPDEASDRANALLETLDRLNLYRIAAEKAPFDIPVKSAFRFTSGFGPRWGRMHNGTDFAAAHGTPIYSTADGVVIYAGWLSGYGRLIKIQHEFGIETRYAHLSKIRVNVGQRVSRGDRIGDMGNSGRSTGTHLHYEVRVGGTPVNPMTYIKAGKDVF